jgi:hypothetical protein
MFFSEGNTITEKVLQTMIDFEDNFLESDEDIRRRHQLRAFLISCRSRLAPAELGLPLTGRRRVDGLRRSEVAELIGVSEGWYRSLESGRAIRVSPQVISRLSNALRLTPSQQVTLFCLALPEMYRIGVRPHYESPLG